MALFNYYPYTTYNNIKAINLMVESQVIPNSLNDYRTFYSYVIKDGERADMVAYEQYGDSTLDWVIYIINDIVDPYKDWPLSYDQFIAYLEAKYNVDAAKLSSNNYISYYYYTGINGIDDQATISSYNYTITQTTYDMMSAEEKSGWTPKTIWDYESDINESKRNIVLLRPTYIPTLKQQIKDLFNV